MPLDQQQRQANSLAKAMLLQRQRQQAKVCIQDFLFQDLFIEHLGWDHLSQLSAHLPSELSMFVLKPLAHKGGLAVYLCEPDDEDIFPDYSTRRKIGSIRDLSYEHLTIYIDRQKTRQVWQWMEHQPGGKDRSHEHHYYRGQDGEALLQKLQKLAIPIEEDNKITIEKVLSKIKKAFDVDRITKKFYDAFKAEHQKFQTFIEGINHDEHREWYTSVMLSRLMLVYFIEKKGFLDGDEDYLANHLDQLRREANRENTFFSFYRKFLLRLFHEGLGQSEHSPQWEQEFGYVPYLNGGLFEEHHLEQSYSNIQIANEAFEKIFAFFSQWQWHLDTREEHSDNEINPDVLGYIFEKFTNQKEMGAYYTKEEITEYIAKNAIIAYLCDTIAQKGFDLFGPSSLGQKLLCENPDRYFYPSMKKGTDAALPPEIFAGITHMTQRSLWANLAPETHAFPTETWREVIARRQRFETIWMKLVKGETVSISDIISDNLDITTLLHDILRKNQNAELLWHFYMALSQMTLLDPTCGSGAFLLAALHILKPLYDVCLQKMEEIIVADDQTSGQDESISLVKYLTSFRDVLQQVSQHANSDFFVYKSIIMNNLYGVDIKPGAVEICRLRLFLKLVAQVDTIEDLEPLPDVDFNIYPGNSLLGFATHDEVRKAIRGDIQLKMDLDQTMDHIEQELQQANELYHTFQLLQCQAPISSDQKHSLKEQLNAQFTLVTQELDAYLAREYGIKDEEFHSGRWQQQTRPFHWFIQFYEIMKQGGFSVVIGNPPYIEYKEVKSRYMVRNYATFSSGNLYAFVMERSTVLLAPGGRFGMIVPSSATCTDGYIPLQRILLAQNDIHIASFSDQRGKLFDIPHPRLCIIQYQKKGPASSKKRRVFTTPYLKLEPRIPVSPFERLTYIEATDWVRPGIIPRFGSTIEYSIANKLFAQKYLLGNYVRSSGSHRIYYTRKLSWFVQVTPLPPLLLDEQGNERKPSELKVLRFATSAHADIALAVLNSNLFYWFLTTGSDCRNLNKREVYGFPLSMDFMNSTVQCTLGSLARQLGEDFQFRAEQRPMHYKERETLTIQCFFPIRSKPIIDEIDRALANHYGFTEEEIDFLINYDGKYRNGKTSTSGRSLE